MLICLAAFRYFKLSSRREEDMLDISVERWSDGNVQLHFTYDLESLHAIEDLPYFSS